MLKENAKRGKAKLLKSALRSNSNLKPGNAKPFNVTVRGYSTKQGEAIAMRSGTRRSGSNRQCEAIQYGGADRFKMRSDLMRLLAAMFLFSSIQHRMCLLCEHAGETITSVHIAIMVVSMPVI